MKVIGDENLTTKWFWSKSQERHTNRLKEIHSKNSPRINNTQPQKFKHHQTAKPRSSYYGTLVETEIYNSNQKLLGMLTDISSGWRFSSTHVIIDSANNLPKPKSLNYEDRKQESQRIISDNEAIAKRLLRTTNSLSIQKLTEEYSAVLKYKNAISKSKFRGLPKIYTKENKIAKSCQKRA